MKNVSAWCCTQRVAPFAGAWIEIRLFPRGLDYKKSLPSRERGLKCLDEMEEVKK